MDQTYRAFVKPLVFHSIDSEWTSLANLYTSHPVLDEIIKKKIVFHTASNESDNPQLVAGYSCGVLMHAPADNLAMCRTGVLVVKENDGWVPIVVKFKGQPYIVECKGVVRVGRLWICTLQNSGRNFWKNACSSDWWNDSGIGTKRI